VHTTHAHAAHWYRFRLLYIFFRYMTKNYAFVQHQYMPAHFYSRCASVRNNFVNYHHNGRKCKQMYKTNKFWFTRQCLRKMC